jgi:glucose-1-phosphate thymidylyltransferase
MRAIVLAAGEGTRLRPVTNHVPKPLVEIDGEPILTRCFDQLRRLDVDEFVVVVGYKAARIVERYGDSYEGVPITYAHQSQPEGLADALLAGADHVSDTFVLRYGDVLFERAADLRRCLDRHRAAGPHATLLTIDLPRDEAARSGVVVPGEEAGVERVVEKPDDPPSTLALPGFFVFEPSILRACRLTTTSDRDEYELLDAIDLLVHAGCDVELVAAGGSRVNVNTPRDIEAAERLVAGRADGER